MKQLLVHVCLLFGLAASKPCGTAKTKLPQPFTVSTAAEASQLIAAVNCEGGQFVANWLGAISLPETIVIGNGTELTLTGAANATSIIEGSNTTQLFDVFGKLRLTNMTMMEAYSIQYGPAIHGHTGSTVTVTGCIISNGVGARYGALYTSGLFLLKDSILQFNSVKDASEGPAVLADYYYVVTIVNSSFLNSTNQNAVVIQGKGSLLSSTFIGNSATQRNRAGANYTTLQYNANDAVQKDSKNPCHNHEHYVSACTMMQSYPTILYGGAVLSVANTFVTFKDCYFLQNYAVEEGGSIFGFPGSNYTVENSVSRGNSARYGGAITAKGSLQVSDSYFTEQVARFTGGAINTAAGSNSVILNSEFAYNKAISGSAVYASGVLHVAGCNFSNHTAAVSGAAIYSDTTGTAAIEQSVFTSGTAATGAAIYLQSTASITDCVLSNNKAITSGGAVHCDDCILTTANSSYTDNA
eukprot:3198-Heterococcus_DN1.PRE.1